MNNFNEIFRKDVPYDNIKSLKKPGIHRLCRRYIFWKTTGGGQFDPPPPPPPSRFRVNAGLSEKFLIAEHLKEDRNEQDFKRYSGILDLLKKSPKTREAFIKLNMIASKLDLLKIFSEVIERDSCTGVFLWILQNF